MKPLKGGAGHLVGLAFLQPNDSRRVACPKCGAKPVARCIGTKGAYLKRTHNERTAAFKASKEQS